MPGGWWTPATPPSTSATAATRSPKREYEVLPGPAPRRRRRRYPRDQGRRSAPDRARGSALRLDSSAGLGGRHLLLLDRGAGGRAHGTLARGNRASVLAVVIASDVRGTAHDPAQARPRRRVLRARAAHRSRLAAGIAAGAEMGSRGSVRRCGAVFAHRRVAPVIRAESDC